MQEQHKAEFRPATVADGGQEFQYRAAGAGAAVIDIQTGARPARLHELLAAQHRVLIFDSDGGQDALSLSRVFKSLKVGPFSLILRAADWPRGPAPSANPALRALVLLAPSQADDAAMVASPDLPMLVLVGARGSAASQAAGRRLRAGAKQCHFVLVYDAADDLDVARPEAVAGAIGDFVAQPERFLVNAASGQLYP